MQRQEETMKRQEETMNAVLELRARQGQTADTRSSRTRAALQGTCPFADVSCAVHLAVLCCCAKPVRLG